MAKNGQKSTKGLSAFFLMAVDSPVKKLDFCFSSTSRL